MTGETSPAEPRDVIGMFVAQACAQCLQLCSTLAESDLPQVCLNQVGISLGESAINRTEVNEITSARATNPVVLREARHHIVAVASNIPTL